MVDQSNNAITGAITGADASLDEAPIIKETGPAPTLSIIWMHGLGADGNDFVPVVDELGLPADASVRFIFPHAREMPVTWNGGYVMRSWYDIVSVEDDARHADVAGVLASRERIRALIAAERARGVPSNRIVLAGFSQGGAMAYTVGMTHPERLAGIIALSTYIPVPGLVRDELSPVNLGLPIFAGHGTQDNVVPYALGERARDAAISAGFPVQWQAYPMPHSVCLEEIVDIGQWIRAYCLA
jgi:phospholipase/carboxylesterase